jgi:hypothetical protein
MAHQLQQQRPLRMEKREERWTSGEGGRGSRANRCRCEGSTPCCTATDSGVRGRKLWAHSPLFASALCSPQRLLCERANPPPLASSVPFLASRGVELQLIAHFLPAVDLLRLARCFRATLAALSDEYAWRFVPPPLHSVTSPNLPSLVAKSLLRFCGISVRLYSSLPLDAVWRPFLPAVDALLPSIRGVMIQVDDPEADCSQGGLFTLISNLAEQCKRQPLTSVHYRGIAYSCPLTRCADGELASLQSPTLDLLPPPSAQGLQLQLKDPASHFARLCNIAASSPALTSLEVHFHAQAVGGRMLRAVTLACGKLRRLSLSGCSAEQLAQWQERIRTLQPPSLLRELRLSRILRGGEICAEEIPRGACRGLFNHLPHLDTLQLERCDCLQDLLEQAVSVPSLRCLRLDLHSFGWWLIRCLACWLTLLPWLEVLLCLHSMPMLGVFEEASAPALSRGPVKEPPCRAFMWFPTPDPCSDLMPSLYMRPSVLTVIRTLQLSVWDHESGSERWNLHPFCFVFRVPCRHFLPLRISFLACPISSLRRTSESASSRCSTH